MRQVRALPSVRRNEIKESGRTQLLASFSPFWEHFTLLMHVRVRRGDESVNAKARTTEFLERALDEWGDLVYRLALSQMRSPHDADDVAQEVFLKLLQDTTVFENEEHLRAWLVRVTVNRCKELHRSAWRRRVDAVDSSSPELANLEAPAKELVTSEVWEAVRRLPEKARLIVHLHYFEGYSLDEIAHITRCNPATVRTRLYRARKKLKLDLEQEAERETAEQG